MRAVGIIAEWHPFHHGHAYQLGQARAQSQADVVIGVMSGNYVQRGEPAMISKWDRAEVAINNGCDLVIELPFWYATQPADYFAQGGVEALAALGCDDMSFGVEDDNFRDYEALATWMVAHPDLVEAANQKVADMDNMSYAEKQIQAIKNLQSDYPELAKLKVHFRENANTLLAFAYAKANAQLGHPVRMVSVKRIGDNHRLNEVEADRLQVADQVFTSGSAIRRHLFSQVDHADHVLEKMMPKEMVDKLLAAGPDQLDVLVSWDDLFTYLKYQLLTANVDQLGQLYQVMGGMENRMLVAMKQADDFQAFVQLVRNRNWSVNRVQRTALMVALNVQAQEMQTILTEDYPQPLMVLAANDVGRAYLKTAKKRLSDEGSRWRFVSRVDQSVEELWPMWLKADAVYEILKVNIVSQNFNHPPIFKQ